MKKISLVAAIIALSATSAFAAPTKTYKVTGPVTALTDSTITVTKDNQKWEIARNSSTKLPDTIKVGSKVKVFYSMTASKVEEAPATPTKPTATPDKKAR